VAVVKLSEFPSIVEKTVLSEKMRSTGEARIKSAAKGSGLFVDDQTEIPKGKNGRILIADAEEINLRLLESLFFNENYEVTGTKDGLTAFQLAKENEFQAIIAERTIPKLDGMLLKQNLNQTSLNNQTPFILLTYNKNPEIVQRANRLGIDLVVQKPAIFEEMLGLIERMKARGGK
jgi:PleD family two-component response regulator